MNCFLTVLCCDVNQRTCPKKNKSLFIQSNTDQLLHRGSLLSWCKTWETGGRGREEIEERSGREEECSFLRLLANTKFSLANYSLSNLLSVIAAKSHQKQPIIIVKMYLQGLREIDVL